MEILEDQCSNMNRYNWKLDYQNLYICQLQNRALVISVVSYSTNVCGDLNRDTDNSLATRVSPYIQWLKYKAGIKVLLKHR